MRDAKHRFDRGAIDALDDDDASVNARTDAPAIGARRASGQTEISRIEARGIAADDRVIAAAALCRDPLCRQHIRVKRIKIDGIGDKRALREGAAIQKRVGANAGHHANGLRFVEGHGAEIELFDA